MLAAAIDQGGGPEVLSIHRLPVPKPAAGQVLIEVHAAGVAVWDATDLPQRDAAQPPAHGTRQQFRDIRRLF